MILWMSVEKLFFGWRMEMEERYIEFKVVIYTDGDNVKNETQESKLHDS